LEQLFCFGEVVSSSSRAEFLEVGKVIECEICGRFVLVRVSSAVQI